jgi:hypothetical protein
MFFYYYLPIAIFCGIAGSAIAYSKGRSNLEGFSLGFFLGPVGLIIALVLPRRGR